MLYRISIHDAVLDVRSPDHSSGQRSTVTGLSGMRKSLILGILLCHGQKFLTSHSPYSMMTQQLALLGVGEARSHKLAGKARRAGSPVD